MQVTREQNKVVPFAATVSINCPVGDHAKSENEQEVVVWLENSRLTTNEPNLDHTALQLAIGIGRAIVKEIIGTSAIITIQSPIPKHFPRQPLAGLDCLEAANDWCPL